MKRFTKKVMWTLVLALLFAAVLSGFLGPGSVQAVGMGDFLFLTSTDTAEEEEDSQEDGDDDAEEDVKYSSSAIVGSKVKQSQSYVLLPIGGEKEIFLTEKVDGERLHVAPKKVSWKSSNEKIATVTKKGIVKAKASGTCYIKAAYGGEKYYWAINVTTTPKYNAIKRAKKIAKNSEYSQANRMQEGYYDCSSLVWRAYLPEGIAIGSRYTAPTAADECKIMVGQGKKISGGLSKTNVQKRKLRAGDLVFFKGDEDNGRYLWIYHVEMFTGYDISYVKKSGKVVYATTWANRSMGYYEGMKNAVVCRP